MVFVHVPNIVLKKGCTNTDIRSEKLQLYSSIKRKPLFPRILYASGGWRRYLQWRITIIKIFFYFGHVINSRVVYIFLYLIFFVSRYKLGIIFIAVSFMFPFFGPHTAPIPSFPAQKSCPESPLATSYFSSEKGTRVFLSPNSVLSRLDDCLFECQHLTGCTTMSYKLAFFACTTNTSYTF